MSVRRVGIAGAGLSGAVIARELAEAGGYELFVYEDRPHIAGNCHTERDSRSGVMLHVYGAHVFHTSREDVWRYVNRFATFRDFTCRIRAVTREGTFMLPINLGTINAFFGTKLDPDEAEAFLASKADSSITHPQNFEEQALAMIGRELYEAFFRGYTLKQWGVDPKRLPASILKRLPVRFTDNDDYFEDTYQGIPEEGYTAMVEAMLDHPAITLKLGERLDPSQCERFDHVFYSGPIDGFFGHRLGRLGYRSLRFERIDAEGDFQEGPVVNYCEGEVPWTRIFEYKHFTPWETHERTAAFKQYPLACGPEDEPFYPLRLVDDKALLSAYEALANDTPGVTFVGRLGTYRYLDMHVAIGEALDCAHDFIAHDPDIAAFRAFSRPPSAQARERR